MWKHLCLALLTAFVAVPAAADESGVKVSVGYAFLEYLEEGGGNTPVGGYLSLAPSDKQLGFEVDVGYHRESESFFDETWVWHALTAALGPRQTLGSGEAKPFLHLLGGLRYDKIEGESNTSFGGMAGGGVDIPVGSSMSLHLGADFQIFFDEGESLKTLRLAAGLTF